MSSPIATGPGQGLVFSVRVDHRSPSSPRAAGERNPSSVEGAPDGLLPKWWCVCRAMNKILRCAPPPCLRPGTSVHFRTRRVAPPRRRSENEQSLGAAKALPGRVSRAFSGPPSRSFGGAATAHGRSVPR